MKQVTINMEFSNPSNKECHPVIKKHAPTSMCGEEFQRHVNKERRLDPNITVGAFGGGSLGEASKSLDYTQSFRWLFTGHKRANDNARYTKLVWTLDDQEEGAEIPFARPINAAVILAISDPRPFNILVSIKGKLRSIHERMKDLHFTSRDPSVSNELRPIFRDPLACLDTSVEKLEETIRDENRRHWIPEYKAIQPAIPTTDATAPAQTSVSTTMRLLGEFTIMCWRDLQSAYTTHAPAWLILLLATVWENLWRILDVLQGNPTT